MQDPSAWQVDTPPNNFPFQHQQIKCKDDFDPPYSYKNVQGVWVKIMRCLDDDF